MMCSFHRPEPEHPIHQWTIPSFAPKPNEVEIDTDFYRRWRDTNGTSERMKEILEGYVQVIMVQSVLICYCCLKDVLTLFLMHVDRKGLGALLNVRSK